jgi:hypothetical protein
MQQPQTESLIPPSADDGVTPRSCSAADAGTSVGAFTSNMFVCILTNAAADYKSDTSLNDLISSLALPIPSTDDSAVKITSETQPPPDSTATGSTSTNPSNAASSSSSAFSLSSSLIICPVTSPNALAIASYCQMWKPNAIWPCCSFVMVAPCVPVAAIYESSSVAPHCRISSSCNQTRAALVQQCTCHLRSFFAPILDALPHDQYLQLTTGTHGPFPPQLSGERIDFCPP